MPVKLVSAGGGGVILQPASSIGSDVVIETPVVAQRLIGNKTAGTVLQVVQTVKPDTYAITNTTAYTEITGLNATITPSAASNKILVVVNLGIATASDGNTRSAAFRLYRNGSMVSGANGNPLSSRIGSWFRCSSVPDSNHGYSASASYLDSPGSVAAQTYSLWVDVENGIDFILNRARGDIDNADAYGTRTVSTITLWEIAA